VGHFECKLQTEGPSPTTHCWRQRIRVIALSCDIKISAVYCLVLLQSTHVTDRWMDRQTDGQTDRITTPKTTSVAALLGKMQVGVHNMTTKKEIRKQ